MGLDIGTEPALEDFLEYPLSEHLLVHITKNTEDVA